MLVGGANPFETHQSNWIIFPTLMLKIPDLFSNHHPGYDKHHTVIEKFYLHLCKLPYCFTIIFAYPSQPSKLPTNYQKQYTPENKYGTQSHEGLEDVFRFSFSNGWCSGSMLVFKAYKGLNPRLCSSLGPRRLRPWSMSSMGSGPENGGLFLHTSGDVTSWDR